MSYLPRQKSIALHFALTVVLAVLSLIFASVARATEAQWTGGGTSAQVCNAYNWCQDVQIFHGDQIEGATTLYFGSGFNGSHVTSCTVQISLVSSYGTTHTISGDCTVAAQSNSSGSAFGLFGFGSGRVGAAGYVTHACATVIAVGTYSNCTAGVAHPVSPTLYKNY